MDIHEARRCIRFCANYLQVIDESSRAAYDLQRAVDVIVKYNISKTNKKRKATKLKVGRPKIKN